MQIREDARWRTDRDGARLELYTENESHMGLIAVREWCTYAADVEAPHTRARKSLHITARMVLRPWWLLGAERKLEAFLVRRWLHALQLGLAADDALCAEVLAERAAGVAEPPAEQPSTPPAGAPQLECRFPPAPRGTDAPQPAVAWASPPPSPAQAPQPRRKQRRILPALLTVAKIGAAAVLARALPVAFGARR